MQLILLNSKRSISFSVDNVCSKKDIFVFNEVKKKNEHKVNDYIKRKNNRKTVKTDFIVKEREGGRLSYLTHSMISNNVHE